MAMKSAMEELYASQIEFVSDSALGANETITYTHSSGTVVENLGVFADKPKFNDEAKSNKRIDTVTFTNVKLDEEPTEKDSISYLGEAWRVKEWSISIGLYIIRCTANKRHSVSHRK